MCQVSDCEVAVAALKQRSTVQCDSCGCLSAEDGDQDRATTLKDNDALLMARLSWCVKCCRNLCRECVDTVGCLTATKSHHVVSLSSIVGREFQDSPSPTHVDCTADLFCWHCRQLVCAKCTSSPEHRDHSCDDVTSSASRLRTLLLDDAASVDEQRRRCVVLEADVAADKYNLLSSIDTAENEIKAAADTLRALVDRHCASLCDLLASTKQRKLKELKSRQEDLAQECSRLDSLTKTINTALDAAADAQLLLRAGNLHESADRCLADSALVTTDGSFHSHQTVVFVPSVAGKLGLDDGGDNPLGCIKVVGGAAAGVTEIRPTASAVSVKPSWTTSEITGRVRSQRRSQGQQQQQQPTLYYRQLLATLNEGQLPVSGLAVVADRLYVCRSQSPDVDVYDAGRTSYRRQESIRVPGLTEPSDMAGTHGDGEAGARLFISSESDGLVFRVTLITTSAGTADVHTRWVVDDLPYGVSTMKQSKKHLLVLSRAAASVSVLDDDGRQLRRLRLPASVASPWSAIHLPPSADLSTGDLVVCHGHSTPTADGRRRCVSRLDWSTGTVTQRYVWVHRSSAERYGRCSVMHMVTELDGSGGAGGFLLADQCADSVHRVDTSLTSHQTLLQTSAGDDDDVVEPRRLCVDTARQRLVVGLDDGRVKVFANGCTVM